MAKTPEKARLGPISLGLAMGIVTAVFVFIVGLTAGIFGWGVGIVQVLATLYVGYSATFVGSIAGAVWGFVDGFVFGVLVALLYNRFVIVRR